MKKPAPYSDIFKLPGLLDTYISAYSTLLTEMEKPILAAIDEARARVFGELKGKLCEDSLRQKFIDRFSDLHENVWAKICRHNAFRKDKGHDRDPYDGCYVAEDRHDGFALCREGQAMDTHGLF